MTRADGGSVVSIGLVYPELLGTYGDGGNAIVLARRLAWRGIDAEVVPIVPGAGVPRSCDVYVLGGGEDQAQAAACAELAAGGALGAAVERGAPVLAVCAGFQIVGRSYPAGGETLSGLGLVDCTTARKPGRRIGEVVADPDPQLGFTLPPLTGFENHAGITTIGPGVTPLGRVRVGEGNGVGDGTDGAVVGRVVCTYLHGPALARNPALADLLLSWVVGDLTPVPAQHDAVIDRLRAERLRAATAGATDRWRPRRWRRRAA